MVDIRSMVRQRRATWDREYASKGDLWRGVPDLDKEIDSDGKILELGCGNGKTLTALSGIGAAVVGLDFSRSGLRLCQKTLGNKVDLVQANVLDLPFTDGSFSTILCFHLMEHLFMDERERACAEMVRVLRQDGRLFFRAFSVNDMRSGKGEEIEPRTYVRGLGINTHYFDESEVKALFPSLLLQSLEHQTVEKRYDAQVIIRDRIMATFVK